jgi:hypothetical protein
MLFTADSPKFSFFSEKDIMSFSAAINSALSANSAQATELFAVLLL